MASFEQNNILFSNVTTGISKPGKFYNGNNMDFSDVEYDGVKSFVNAVEIDWNGATLDDDTVINTTGELLSLIQTLRGEVTELESKLDAQ